MNVAVNLADLSQCFPNPTLASMLLSDFVAPPGKVVIPNKNRIDTAAIVLDGPAAQNPQCLVALVSLLQTVYGPRKIRRRIRVYQQGKRNAWKEIVPRKQKCPSPQNIP